MGSNSLRQFLISLCHDSHWKYAVFWKLNHQNPMILTLEAGYSDITKPAEFAKSTPDDISFNEAKEISYSSGETSMQNNGSGGCPIGLAVANMSSLQYVLGEGLVGEVAYTGKYGWFSFDSFLRDFSTNLIHDRRLEEWLFQFALGIKTILLVPVLPDGVLQLGSFEVVAEDLTVVASVIDRFVAFRNVAEKILPSTPWTKQTQSSSSPFSSLVDSSNEQSGLIISQLKDEKLEDDVIMRMKEKELSTLKQPVLLQTVKDTVHGNDSSVHGESIPPNLETPDTSMFELSSLEELLTYSFSSHPNVEMFGEPFNRIDPYSAGNMTTELFADNNNSCKTMNTSYRFPEDCELHEALGQDFRRNTYEHLSNSSFFVENACDTSSDFCQKDFMGIIEPSWFTQGSDEKDLLVAAVADLSRISDDISSKQSGIDSCKTSPSKSSTICQPQVQSKERSRIGNDSVPCNLTTSAFTAKDNAATSFSDIIRTLINKEQQLEGHDYVQSGKGKTISNAKGKPSRARNGKNPKPRPRDRQLIQDRVKELRELVPNGAKCSIDNLLDQTVKHMLHLRSVTDQAKKLKGFTPREVGSHKNVKQSGNHDTFHNGTSRAFDFGSNLQVCPIVVDDLDYPGRMLIEILCDDHGTFLEIAQLIKRLELTILKGAMENHSNNTWARFVVEASKCFHRMEIFWPLLHLFQRGKSSISSKI
ncbi:hypothetical protein UlMin_000466 [Ulmus minor]